jgi:hypothetical protein
MMVRSLFLSVLCLSCVSGMAQGPDNCEPLRLQIEQKIAANGVSEFSVTVVDVEADAAAGTVVGSCDRGRQKIMYIKGQNVSQPANRTTAPLPKGNSGILTECKDGTVTMGGTCKP